MKVPAVDAVGGVIVTAAAPTFPVTSANADRTGVVWVSASTFIEKCWPAHAPAETDDHDDPESVEESVENEGVGETSVPIDVELHFHPRVPPAPPETTTK